MSLKNILDEVMNTAVSRPVNESEDEIILNSIIKNAIEKVGMIPDKDVRDAEHILKKYNGDYTLALNALAKKINETENKAISERFVNCIRVIHALKTENDSK